MVDDVSLVVGGQFNEGCIALLDGDGKLRDFVAPPGYAGPSFTSSYQLQYGPTATTCVLLSRRRPGQSERVHCFDVTTGALDEVAMDLPELDGSVSRLDLLSADGSDADALIEKQGNSYGRSFLVRVRNDEVISKTYAPVRSTFTRHHQIVAKRRRGEPKKMLLIESSTGKTTELMAARSPKAQLDAYSLAPDRSMVLVAHCEWLDSGDSSRQTEFALFNTSDGAPAGSIKVSGGEANVAWLGMSHLAVTISGSDFTCTAQIFELPGCTKVGEIRGWKSALYAGLRNDRIWGLDCFGEQELSVISAPITGGPITVHHYFEQHEQPGLLPHGILTLPMP